MAQQDWRRPPPTSLLPVCSIQRHTDPMVSSLQHTWPLNRQPAQPNRVPPLQAQVQPHAVSTAPRMSPHGRQPVHGILHAYFANRHAPPLPRVFSQRRVLHLVRSTAAVCAARRLLLRLLLHRRQIQILQGWQDQVGMRLEHVRRQRGGDRHRKAPGRFGRLEPVHCGAAGRPGPSMSSQGERASLAAARRPDSVPPCTSALPANGKKCSTHRDGRCPRPEPSRLTHLSNPI